MSEFKPIETQEALDAIIKDRLERNTKSVTEKVTEEITNKFNEQLAGLSEVTKNRDELKANLESLQTQLETYQGKDAELADMQAKLAEYETNSVKMEIAKQCGIPLEFYDRLQGGDRDAILKDAEALAKSLKTYGGGSPRPNPDAGGFEDGVTAAFKKLNPNIKL